MKTGEARDERKDKVKPKQICIIYRACVFSISLQTDYWHQAESDETRNHTLGHLPETAQHNIGPLNNSWCWYYRQESTILQFSWALTSILYLHGEREGERNHASLCRRDSTWGRAASVQNLNCSPQRLVGQRTHRDTKQRKNSSRQSYVHAWLREEEKPDFINSTEWKRLFSQIWVVYRKKTHMIFEGTGGLDAPGTLLKGTWAVLRKCPGTCPDSSLLCTEKASIPRPPSCSQSRGSE